MATPLNIQKLIGYLVRLPGIGPRQAARFAYALLDWDKESTDSLAAVLADLKKSVQRCNVCGRAIEKTQDIDICTSCKNLQSGHPILVIEKDQDLENIERSGYFQGAYHLLGGLILDEKKEGLVHKRVKGLYERIETLMNNRNLKKPIEIIVAVSATPEGDATALYLERVLEPFIKKNEIQFQRLGRGLSTGSELEYADPETIKFALKNRK